MRGGTANRMLANPNWTLNPVIVKLDERGDGSRATRQVDPLHRNGTRTKFKSKANQEAQSDQPA